MNLPKRWLGSVLLSVAAFFLIIAALFPTTRWVALPDGTRLTLAWTVRSGQRNFYFGSPVLNSLRRWVPTNGISLFGYWIHPVSHMMLKITAQSTNDLRLMFFHEGLTTNNAPEFKKNYSGVVFDRNRKLISEAKLAYMPDWQPPFSVWTCEVPPDSDRDLEFILFHADSETNRVKVAEFKIKNPI